MAFTMNEMVGDMKIYFNWSLNALVPFNSRAADYFLIGHKQVIISVAQRLLTMIEFTPADIYRGIILREEITILEPHKNFEYLSFSEDYSVANHFADVNGFGSDVVDIKKQLGTHGYIIKHRPDISEILFHHKFLSMLPYTEALSRIGMDGAGEVAGLRRQKEIMILQPKLPFTDITKY